MPGRETVDVPLVSGSPGPHQTQGALSELDVSTLYRTVDRNLLPTLLACYIVAYIDRINISYAQLQMKAELGFTDQVYGLAAGLFFVTYFIFEIPSNIYLQRTGARKTLARILVLWGLTSCATLLVRSSASFYVLRLFLGAFEAGLAPGVMFYLTLWYPNDRRAQRNAIFLSGAPIAGVIGAPLTGLILGNMQGVLGLAGWQWMFFLEGLPAIILGILVLVTLADGPQDAAWLGSAEKHLLVRNLRMQSGRAPGGSAFSTILTDLRVYAFALTWFTLVCGIYALTFWMPVMIQAAGAKGATAIGLWAAIPYAAGVVGMILLSRMSDRLQERRWHYLAVAAAGAGSLLAASLVGQQLALVIVLLSIATPAIFAGIPIFYAVPMSYLPTSSAAGGLALINCLGLTGGFFSPFFLGWIKTSTGSLTPGLWVIGSGMLVGGMVLLATTKSTTLSTNEGCTP